MTRTLAAAAALVLALVAARPAFAQPPGALALSAPPAADPDAPPPVLEHYLGVGVGLGGYNELLIAGAQLDAGLRIPGSPLWLHGAVGAGSTARLFDTGTGSYVRVTAGLEAHGCLLRNTFCVFGGVDAGVLHAQFSGTDSFSLSDSPTMDVVESTHIVAVPRAGFDVGSQTVRFRWTLDVPLDLGGPDPSGGAIVAVAVAYRW